MQTEPKRLYRSRTDRMVGGICGGLSKYLNLDTTVIRLLFLLLGFVSGGVPALVVYLIMLIVVPEEPLGAMPPAAPPAEVIVEEPPTPEI